MHDLIFGRQNAWSPKDDARGDFEDYAGEIGLDKAAYRECMRDGRYLEQIFAAAKYGQRLGVNSTPTLFINGARAPQDYQQLEQMILEAAAASERSEDAEAEGAEG